VVYGREGEEEGLIYRKEGEGKGEERERKGTRAA
jgi:hypothetical protein